MNDKDRVVVRKMLKYCEKVYRYVDNMTEQIFADREETQDACALCILQIGELSKSVSEETKKSYDQISWREMRDARNFMAHTYETVDIETLWYTVSVSIPQLKEQLNNILKD